MKKLVFTFFVLIFCAPVLGYNLDLSVNKEIQTKYNANKLNEDMQISSPDEIVKNKNNKNSTYSNSSSVPKSSLTFESDKPNITADSYNYSKNNLKRGTFPVKSNQKISDWLSKGTVVSFTTTSSVSNKSMAIPQGAIFKGEITKNHHPQRVGNGALVEINITSLTYNGKTYPVLGKITKAGSDKIFFNKIKGERQYIKGVNNKIKSADNFYSKTKQISNKLSKNPLGAIIAPIPKTAGFVGSSAGTIISPITGMLEKGGNVSYPAGTYFEIKLLNKSNL